MGFLGEDPIDPPPPRLVRIARRVFGEERVQFLRCRRQPGQVEEQSAQRHSGFRRRRGLEPARREAFPHEGVDGMVGRRGKRGLHRRREGPVLFVLGAAVDPALDRLAFLRRERSPVRAGRRHPPVGIIADDPLPQLARLHVPGHERGSSVAVRRGTLGGIEPQAGLPLRRIRSVALEAAVREDRAHVATVAHLGLVPGAGEHRRERREQDREKEQAPVAWSWVTHGQQPSRGFARTLATEARHLSRRIHAASKDSRVAKCLGDPGRRLTCGPPSG